MSDIKKLINDARLKFFQPRYNLSYFGLLLYRFNIIPVVADINTEGFVLLNNDENKIGDIFINEIYLNKPDYTHDNLAFLECHEMCHILYKHFTRCQNRDKILWNIATDHCVERDLKKMCNNHIYPYKHEYNIINELN